MSPFHYLATAIEAHLQRFPSIKTGLNNIENSILKTTQNQFFTSKKEFISKLITTQKVYGLGDLQYEHSIDTLKPLFSSFNPVKLSKKGKQVLENQLNFYGQIRNDISWLGGSKKYSFLFDNNAKKLLQITS
jgi:hypothetical protein